MLIWLKHICYWGCEQLNHLCKTQYVRLPSISTIIREPQLFWNFEVTNKFPIFNRGGGGGGGRVQEKQV